MAIMCGELFSPSESAKGPACSTSFLFLHCVVSREYIFHKRLGNSAPVSQLEQSGAEKIVF